MNKNLFFSIALLTIASASANDRCCTKDMPANPTRHSFRFVVEGTCPEACEEVNRMMTDCKEKCQNCPDVKEKVGVCCATIQECCDMMTKGEVVVEGTITSEVPATTEAATEAPAVEASAQVEAGE